MMIREQLINRQKELIDRIKRLEIDIKRKNGPLERSMNEQSLSLENNEVLDAIDTVERHELSHVDRALMKIDAGIYGQCEICKDAIGEKRLRAIPYALTCTKCMAKKEAV